MAFLVLSAAAFAVTCGGLAATLTRRWRLSLWLYLAGSVINATGDIIGSVWWLAVVNALIAVTAAWALWHFRRRRKRAPRAYGARSRGHGSPHWSGRRGNPPGPGPCGGRSRRAQDDRSSGAPLNGATGTHLHELP